MILASQQQDPRDEAKLRRSRDRHLGRVADTGLRSCYPFFFTRDAATLHLTGIYRGASCFIIGGGPSFSKIPKDKLKGVWAMTLNNAHASYRSQACCTVDDPSRFSLSMWLDPAIQKFVPTSHFEHPLWDNRMMKGGEGWRQHWERANLRVGDCPNIVGFRRNERFQADTWLHEDTVNWGQHQKFGGGRSVLLAALRIVHLLGFRRVYLLGVDFEMTAEKRYHFDEQRSGAAVEANNSVYQKLQGWLAELQPHFLEADFVVKNCNVNSRLEVFPMVSFQDAIEAAQERLGDHSREQTYGMYTPLPERAQSGGSSPEGR